MVCRADISFTNIYTQIVLLAAFFLSVVNATSRLGNISSQGYTRTLTQHTRTHPDPAI